ncbi:MAG: argininosuccinate lyase [Anaerococcus sp.]|uniref:argininosuccinate lyase n=1 Tax=Anaerococcus sp. TaxID=1872515 RepID=UPI00260B3203|nr:argininosuccinate lyase [Anaerococcus sp.]MCI5972032.1 argininosuccinate lyase [Anaerococcus sp.]MDD6918359.1 argininosuccinate lyase [Peptoniphilaceae bacterium]MDY2927242.1 argininosuccinate lyase [Anaerococcus sp.]
MKLWSGMLTGELDKLAEEFNNSIKIDKRLVYCDIEGSIAHVEMLGKNNIISDEEKEQIITGLCSIYKNLKEGKEEVDESYEDIHTFVEARLIEEIGPVGKKMHTARSRNDQVTTDFKLYLRNECESILEDTKAYVKSLIKLARKNTKTIMPGYTHLQAAQAVTFAHHLMAYAMMGLRDIERIESLKERMNELPLGACALAGTTYDIDRDFVKEKLGFTSLMQNSMDAVSDRDYVIELSSIISLISIHLSRLSEELIIFSSQPYSFVRIDDKYSTGSSIMPQKKNPDMAELIRAKAARLIANTNQSMVMMKGLPLAYSKDMQEDKEGIFESIDTIRAMLKIMAGQIESLKVNKEKMLAASKEGYLNATDVADYLVGKNLPFRDAHHISARLVKYAMEKNLCLEDLPLEIYKNESDLFEEDIYQAIDLYTSVNKRDSLGGPSEKEVLRQIAYVEEKLER